MATYPPPTETLPTFNSTAFTSSLTDGLTIAEADTRYLRFPIGQGDETISNLDVVGTLTAGTFAPTTLTTNTIQGTAVGTAVSLYNEVARTGEIQIGKDGTSTKTITIGNDTATTTALKGSTITATKMAVAGTLSAGASTLTSVQTNTIAGTAVTIQPVTSLLIGTTSSIPITIGSSSTIALNGASTLTSATVTGALSAGSISTVGTLGAGASTLTSVTTNTITGTAVGTAVSLYNEALRTGEIQIGKDGTQTKTITIGNDTATTTALKGSTITATKMAVAGVLSAGASTLTSVISNTYNATAVGSTMTIGNNITTGSIDIGNTTTGGIGIGTTSGSGTISIGYSQAFVSNTNKVDILTGSNCSGTVNISTGNTASKDVNIGGLNTTLNLIGSTINASKMAIAGVLSAGASTLTSVATNTITGATIQVSPSVGINVADQLTTGTINIGRQDTTSTSTLVNIASGNGQTGTISLGTGTGTKIMNIGGTSTTLGLIGSAITASLMSITGALSAGASTLTSVITDAVNGTAVGTLVSLYGEGSRSGAIEIGNGGSRSGDIRIGNGASTTGAVLIGRNGGGVSIGTSGSTTTIDGTTNIGNGTHTITGITNINTTGTNLTTLGSATASTTIGGALGVTGATTLSSTVAVTGNATFNGNVTLGNASTDEITPTGTVKVPFNIGYASWSNSSTTNVSTYLGGTLQTSKTQTAVATGTFSYVMSSVTPYSAGGGVTLSGGTYMFWMGMNMEDTGAFDVTDLRMGLTTTSSLTAGSSEADFFGGCPNATCYFHKTDSTASVASDSENRVLSGCFYNSSISAVYYPFYYINNNAGGGIDTIETDVLIVKIGGGV